MVASKDFTSIDKMHLAYVLTSCTYHHTNQPSGENTVTDKQWKHRTTALPPSQNPIKSSPPRGKEKQHIFTATGWGCEGLCEA